MRKAVRQAVRQQYTFHCGYCGITETDNGALLTIDHFQPQVRGGTDALSNLVYACHACNENKGDWWQPDKVERVLHPLNEDLTVHLHEQDDGTLVALTETGMFHIRWLKLNRPPLVAYRRDVKRRDAELEERRETLALVQQIDRRLSHLEEAMYRQKRGGE